MANSTFSQRTKKGQENYSRAAQQRATDKEALGGGKARKHFGIYSKLKGKTQQETDRLRSSYMDMIAQTDSEWYKDARHLGSRFIRDNPENDPRRREYQDKRNYSHLGGFEEDYYNWFRDMVKLNA